MANFELFKHGFDLPLSKKVSVHINSYSFLNFSNRNDEKGVGNFRQI